MLLAVGIAAVAAGTVMGFSIEFNTEAPPRALVELLMWVIIVICGWCWTGFMLFVGMRYLDHDSKALRYGQTTLLPFFVVHQPVILAIAYWVVQWEADVAIKLLVVVFGAFLVALGLAEFVIKRVGILRVLFGMKAGQPDKAQAAADELLEPQSRAP
jgi:hypothetical protein